MTPAVATSESEIKRRLTKIKEMGWVKTHRLGDTGIGKTLEDLSDIPENNIPGPDDKRYELKAARKNSASMLTLFTKSPLPPKANSVLLQKFGYLSAKGNEKKELHTTVSANRLNTLKGKPGLKISVKQRRVNLVDQHGKVLGYWDNATLKIRFEAKYPGLLYVKAQNAGKGKKEEFFFDEAWFLWGFSFQNSIKLLEEDVIKVDIRIGQYPNGSPHDHGTGFRVMPDKLELCFEHRKQII